MIEAWEVAPAYEAELTEARPVTLAAAAPRVAPYGSWLSPITAEMVARAGLRFGEVRPTPDGAVWWVEGRPQEGGRNVVVRWDASGTLQDITPEGFNTRTRVHEYGGGAFAVHLNTQGSTIVAFVHFANNRLYRQNVDPDGTVGAPFPLTPDDSGLRRYAEPIFDATRGRIIAVCEDHRPATNRTPPQEPRNYLVAVALDPSSDGPAEPITLTEGHDFYSSPRLSTDGGALCFLAWNHPNMPWFDCTLYAAQVAADGFIREPRIVAGGSNESVFQPEWGPNSDALYFVSDRDTGWWNLYRCTDPLTYSSTPEIERITGAVESEFAAPQWYFGMSTYDFLPSTATVNTRREEVVCTFTRDGKWELARVDPDARRLIPISTGPYTDIGQVRAATGPNGTLTALFIGGGPETPTGVVRITLTPDDGGGTPLLEVLRTTEPLSDEVRQCLSTPVTITFPTVDGQQAYAIFYPPYNPGFSAPNGEHPPILVKGHGGPTAAASTRLSLGFQYWTSRGVGVLDVNYGGSTGYGREFRCRLYRQWGVTDVDDCISATRHLVERGKADKQRLFISGGSAGGYTALRAITLRPGVFTAAASFYGIGDLEALARDTHKFESRYLDWLIGPYPDDQATYRDRSPIHHIDKLSVPVAFFQGSEDRIVPPNQAGMMVDALRNKSIPVGYFLFEGEGHGFRQSGNIVRATEGELYFYSFTALRAGLQF